MRWFLNPWGQAKRFDRGMFVATMLIALGNGLAFVAPMSWLPGTGHPDAINAVIALALPFLAVRGLMSAVLAQKLQDQRKACEAIEKAINEILEDNR